MTVLGITNATYTSPGWTHYKYPLSLSPVPSALKPGMIALCVFTFFSCITALSLLGFLSWRFWTTRNDRTRAPLYKNQYMLLIFNLVLADFQLDLGFFFDAAWLGRDEVIAPSPSCFAQGYLVNVGDLASGFFIFAIACHTFTNVLWGRRIGLVPLGCCIVGLWILALILTCIPIILHPSDIFVVQGNWCSINGHYDQLRLYFHYIWVFIAEGLVLVLYIWTFFVLRKRMGSISPQLGGDATGATASNARARAKNVTRATTYMILYPIIYVLTTLPLAAGRISSMAGHTLPKDYLIIAGIMMACGGWMNCLLYSLTRHIFLNVHSGEVAKPRGDIRYSMKGSGLGSTTDGVELNRRGRAPVNPYQELPSPGGSREFIVDGKQSEEDFRSSRMEDGVKMKTTWDVQVDEVNPQAAASGEDTLGHRTYISS